MTFSFDCWQCGICDHVVLEVPEQCPRCNAERTSFRHIPKWEPPHFDKHCAEVVDVLDEKGLMA